MATKTTFNLRYKCFTLGENSLLLIGLIITFTDLAQITVSYQGSEKSDVTVAEGDPFTLICKVGFRSNMASGTWPPTLTWYDYNNQVITSNDRTAGFIAQRNATINQATLDMHGQQYQCHTSFENPPAGAITPNTSTHVYSSDPPIYTADNTTTVTVHCE